MNTRQRGADPLIDEERDYCRKQVLAKYPEAVFMTDPFRAGPNGLDWIVAFKEHPRQRAYRLVRVPM
jgi:hypothetical protein